MRKIFSVLGIVLAVSITTRAQSQLPDFFKNLQTGGNLPEGLQSTRSAVFLKMDSNTSIDSAAWYNLADEFHKGMVDMHIDAVAYYRWRDLNSGFDATGSYLEGLVDREINQVILLEVTEGTYQVYIVDINTEESELLDNNRNAWHISGNTVENVLSSMSLQVGRAGLEVGNFLISSSPEFFIDTPIFTKNRFESFQPDLKLDKLAVPLFQSPDPENIAGPDDLELQSIMESQYPFEYQLVGSTMSEDLMQKAGFHYVLRYLYSEESTLLTLLDYQAAPDNPAEFGYKYYFKHLATGDIYLGDSWDSRPSWQDALRIQISNLKRSLKVE